MKNSIAALLLIGLGTFIFWKKNPDTASEITQTVSLKEAAIQRTNLPVNEINDDWVKALALYLNDTDPENAALMMNDYMKAKNVFSKRLSFQDIDLYWSDIHEGKEDEAKILKNIFKKHLPAIERIHREHTSSIQEFDIEGYGVLVPLI